MLPLLSGKANVFAYKVAWKRAVQSQSRKELLLGILVFGPSMLRSKLCTPMESSHTWLPWCGAILVSHMPTKISRKASGNSFKTMDANLKKFNSSFEYVLKEVFGMPGQKVKSEKINTKTSRLRDYLRMDG